MSSFNSHRQSGVLLPPTFKPSMHSVIIGRGKMPKQHIGNKRLTVLATSFLEKYQDGDRKTKSQIVSNIVSMIREACKGQMGAFVKYDKKTGKWFDQDYSISREKVGYVFRDLLSDQYLSSSKSKVAQRQQGRWQRRSSSIQHHQEPAIPPPQTMMMSDDETSSIGSSSYSTTPSYSLSAQHAPIVREVSDILIESTKFLDDFPVADASFQENVESSTTESNVYENNDGDDGQNSLYSPPPIISIGRKVCAMKYFNDVADFRDNNSSPLKFEIGKDDGLDEELLLRLPQLFEETF